jgi:glycosyltransferase involved in cell wall biosynthesis
MMYGAWQHRGIGRYTASILAPLPKEAVIALLPHGQSLDTYRCISAGNSFFPWWEQKILPSLAKKADLTYLLCPSITSPVTKISKVKKIVVIYDLIFMQSFKDLPVSHSLYNNLGRLYRRFTAPKAYSSADILISISEYSKNELHERFGISKDRVHVIPCSITHDWFVEKPVPAQHREPYLLTVTGDGPSKNLSGLLEAYAKSVNNHGITNFKLRIVGVAQSSQSFFINKAKSLGIEDQIVFEKFISNEGLQNLYRKAWASISLSLYEGFGIPIVEAMASGTPVVCSNTTSLPEVAGDVAIFANPRDIDSMSGSILKIIRASPEERDKIALSGMMRSKIFSEEVVSQKIKDFWSKLSNQ